MPVFVFLNAIMLPTVLLPTSAVGQSWNVDANGNWTTGSNWSPAVAPNGLDASANFGAVTTAPRTVTLDVPITVGTLSFSGSQAYTLSGGNALSFDVTAGSALLTVSGSAAHTISAPLNLVDTLAVAQGSSGTLNLTGTISGSGGLTFSGNGSSRLGAANSFLGPAQINSGSLFYGAGGAIPSATTVAIGDGVGASGSARLNIDVSMSPGQAFAVNLATDGLLVQGNNRFTRLNGVSGTGELRVNSAVGNGFEFTVTNDGAFAGLVSGGIANAAANPNAGSRILKTGTGTQTLSGANTYVAQTYISGGSLRAASAVALGASSAGLNNATFVYSTGTLELAGSISVAERLYLNGAGPGGIGALRSFSGSNTVTNGVTLGWSGGGVTASNVAIGGGAGTTLTINGAVDGSVGLSKVGDGLLVLNGPGTWTGGTTFGGGILRQGAATSLPSGTALTFSGGTFDLNGFDRTITNLSGTGGLILGSAELTLNQAVPGTFTGSISGVGRITKTGSGTLTLVGTNSYSGGTTVSAGTLVGDASSLQGNILNDAELVFDQAVAGTFAGSVTGNGSLTKTGPGALALSGLNDVAGGTSVAAGTLSVDGTLFGPIIVETGATLAGTGSVGAVQVLSGGTISPGNSIGTLSLQNLDQQGVYVVEYRSPAGAPLTVPSGSGQSVRGRNSILDPGLPVGDQDADLLAVGGSAQLAPGSTVTLARLGTDASFDTVFDAPGNSNREIRYLILRADGGVAGRYVALSDSGTTLEYLDANSSPGEEDVWLVLRGADIPAIVGSAPAPYTLPMGLQRPRCDLDGLPQNAVHCAFVQGDLSGFDLDADGDRAGTEVDAGQGTVGFGVNTAPGLWLGLALGQEWGDADLSDGTGSADVDQTIGTLWVDWQTQGLDLRGWLEVGRYGLSTSRRTTTGAHATSDHDADRVGIAVELRRWADIDEVLSVSPLLGLAASRLNLDGYTESGGGIENFEAESQSQESVQSLLGIEAKWQLDQLALPVVLTASAGWAHEFADTSASLSGTYAGDATATRLTSTGPSTTRDAVVATIGATFAGGERGSFRLEYGVGYSNSVLDQSAMARWSVAF
jgi:autotransporter-associated beta strand protein